MAHSRPSKCQRVGGAYHDPVPFADDFSIVHSREARLNRVGRVMLSVPTEQTPLHDADGAWDSAESWLPIDDAQYALDPNGEWYDEALAGEVTEDFGVHPHDPTSKESTTKKKRIRSQMSRRPHVFWKDVHRQTYLEELICGAGRGDFSGAMDCPDCVARKKTTSGQPEYHCQDCFLPDLTCQQCCVKHHHMNPLHRVQKWTGSRFVEVSLKSIGLKVQLNHASMFCENPISCHEAFLVIHSNGIHQVSIQYCGCSHAIPQHIQLLRRGFYPATQQTVKTCATFCLLDLLHKFSLTSKASTYDFYRGIERLSNNTGILVPKSRYRVLFRISMQWRHLKLLKWGGRAHDPNSVIATRPGELALLCPSCPRPGINLPNNWEDEPVATKFLYMVFLCMDANFRLKNQMVSSYSQDPGLGTGWAYLVPREGHEAYVLSRTSDDNISISTCVGLQALAKMNSKFSRGLRYTGVGGVMCGRSEMIMPLGIGNLQKGERFSNMDYIFAMVVHLLSVMWILISYDIACQWFVNLHRHIEEHWPPSLKIPSSTKLIPAIPKLHEPMHGRKKHQVYSLNYIPGIGKSDMETPERMWAGHNGLGNSTKTQGPGGRHNVLDDHFSFWNWLKYVGLGKTLMLRYKAALAERNQQAEGHRGLTNSLDADFVAKWEAMCIAWEEDEYPKRRKNPYEMDGLTISEAEARKEFAEDEELRISAGEEALHETSPSEFIFIGLELEDMQHHIRLQVKAVSNNATARQSSNLMGQRNLLRNRIRAWEEILPIYIPGLLRHCATLELDASKRSQSQPATGADHPEDAIIWLPSKIPTNLRSRVCFRGLAAIEEKIRTTQCHDNLDALRHVLNVKTRMVYFKNKNVRGQHEGTRSHTVIDRVHERARKAAERYRVARCAKLALSGPGEWEETPQDLKDGDIRAYQDVEQIRLRRGRPGTVEDGQLASQGLAAAVDNGDVADISLVAQVQERRDGTGETWCRLSWIWTTKSRLPNPDDEEDDILRSDWAKSRARSERCREEVLLLKEEMRRVVTFLDWKATWWMDRRNARSGISKDLAEGLVAYAKGQADLQKSLRDHFCGLWRLPLEGNDATPVNDDDNEDEDDSDEDEEYDNEGDESLRFSENMDGNEGAPLDEDED